MIWQMKRDWELKGLRPQPCEVSDNPYDQITVEHWMCELKIEAEC